MCEAMTSSLGAGDTDWGSSTLVNVPDISIEAYTAPESFAVCLILSAGAFQAVVSHGRSSSMPDAIRRFQQQREEHRREALRAGEAVGGLEESRRFAHVEHCVVCWNKFAKDLLHHAYQQDLTRSFTKRLNRTLSRSVTFGRDRAAVGDAQGGSFRDLGVNAVAPGDHGAWPPTLRHHPESRYFCSF
jgi:hypothetical protein